MFLGEHPSFRTSKMWWPFVDNSRPYGCADAVVAQCSRRPFRTDLQADVPQRMPWVRILKKEAC